MKFNKLSLLNCLFVTAIITANLTASKVVDTHIMLGNIPIYIPSVAINYAFAFLCTDVIGELYGKQEAQRTVWNGFICQLIMLLCVLVSIWLPAVDSSFQIAYELVLGQSLWFVIGSFIGYFISQSWDVWIFHKIRDRFQGNPKYKWIWNNASTLTSQLLDTIIFITISFGIGKQWLFSIDTISLIIGMIIGQYLLKSIFAILDTPFFYLLTKNKKSLLNINEI